MHDRFEFFATLVTDSLRQGLVVIVVDVPRAARPYGGRVHTAILRVAGRVPDQTDKVVNERGERESLTHRSHALCGLFLADAELREIALHLVEDLARAEQLEDCRLGEP